jgi:hypothetical protein
MKGKMKILLLTMKRLVVKELMTTLMRPMLKKESTERL